MQGSHLRWLGSVVLDVLKCLLTMAQELTYYVKNLVNTAGCFPYEYEKTVARDCDERKL